LSIPIDPSTFEWMFPGERRVAMWGTNRVRKVQRGDSRQLVSGAYVILAAMWGSLGGTVGLIGIVLDATAKSGTAGSPLFVAAGVLLAVGALRQFQSRNARRRGDP
jgi:hypothetical protein